MLGTRRVILEKSNGFARYDTPYNVPDKLWREAFLDIPMGEQKLQRLYVYIAECILAPLINCYNYEITRLETHSGASGTPDIFSKDIIFYKKYLFRTDPQVVGELVSYSDIASPDYLKAVICLIWLQRKMF